MFARKAGTYPNVKFNSTQDYDIWEDWESLDLYKHSSLFYLKLKTFAIVNNHAAPSVRIYFFKFSLWFEKKGLTEL